jgi:purine-binding chemotaxis protein CheW
MKNVIVFALGRSRYAIELRWVREVFALGHVTLVPRAPAAVTGVVNYRGAIMPVLDIGLLLRGGGDGGGARARSHPGDGAILVEVESVLAALRIGNVDEVSTLREGDDAGTLVDSRGRELALLDPPALIERALSAVQQGDGHGD